MGKITNDITRIFGVIMITIASCSPKEEQSKIASDLDHFFSKQFPAQEPGGAILIMKDDSIIFSKGYGIADLQTKEAITPNTLFNLGSISKTFVSNAILMLQEQGKLSVEDSLIKYFPDFKNKDIAKKVKIKHLLTHTSGLPDIRQTWKDTVFYLTAKDAENWSPILKTDSLEFEPGAQFKYSNPAYNGLALIVEQVSGMKWQTFVKENLMEPSGMTTSTITDGPHPESGVSHGYVLNHGKWTEDDYGEEPTFPAAGNGGVWSSVEELAKYEQALEKNVFLKKETVKDSRTIKIFPNWSDATQPNTSWSWFKPRTKDQSNVVTPFIGWSWFIGQTDDGTKVIGHTGSQGGFLCNYVSIPEKKIFFTILCNSPRDVYAFSEEIMTQLKKNNWLE